MTKKELIAALAKYDDDESVVIATNVRKGRMISPIAKVENGSLGIYIYKE